MTRELEERLQAIPERWRDVTRTRTYAVMDYVSAGEDGAILVDVLCRRTGLTRSAFYALVRRWHKSKQDPAALAPWARRVDGTSRISKEVVEYIDGQVEPLIEQDPDRPTEPVAVGVLASWPDHLRKPGISYVRRRVGMARSEHQKKTRRVTLQGGDDGDDPSRSRPEPRWPLDVILIDHIAIEAVVWVDGEPTLPIATIAFDLSSGEPVAISVGLDIPGPATVAGVLAELAVTAAPRAPAPPTVIMSTVFARGWPKLTATLGETGAVVIPERSRKLKFGPDANRLLGGWLQGYKLAPRLGHRSLEERVSPRALTKMPHRELADLSRQLRGGAVLRLMTLIADANWPPAAAARPSYAWELMAALGANYAKRPPKML
jgi:hypothetical protein